jgi:hypothetical protein
MSNNNSSNSPIEDYIADLTHHFTGREWVFQLSNHWLHNSEGSRYFLLTGEPGSGKTAIAVQLYQFSQGNESPLFNLPRNFLSAVHFCSARDSTSVDPKRFARSIALQLAEKFPPFAHALKDVGEKQVNIHIDQRVETAGDSTIQALVINNLDVSGVMTAQEAFDWVVLNPLLSIYQNGFDQPITILVDALDEALTHDGAKTIVDLLSNLKGLPPQVRFILTSRKEARVENKFEDVQELYLSAFEFNQLNLTDVHEYIQKRLTQDEPLSTLVSGLDSHQQEQSIDTIAEKSEGNFLYVRFLLDAIANGQRSLTELEGLPEGLDGLYYQSLERVVELGKQDWYTTYAPFMGILSVARTSLTPRQLQAFTQQPESIIWKCLTDLRQFLEEVEPKSAQIQEDSQYRLYHQSFIDFLRKRSLQLGNHSRHNPYYPPTKEAHQRITNHYWQPTQPLEAIDLCSLDGYAYNHLAYHLLEGDRKDDLYAMLTASARWMKAKFIHCNDDASYAADLDLAINNFSDPLTDSQLLALIQLHTARQVVHQRVNRYDDIDLRTLVWLGREVEAFNHARLRANPQKRFWGLFLLHKLLSQKNQPYPLLPQELQEVANSIEEPKSRVSALGAVACTLTQAECRAKAEAIFAEARQIAFQIDNKSQQAWALKELVISLAHAGYFLEAEEIARAIEDRKWQTWSLTTLGGLLAPANHSEKSKELFAESEAQALILPDDHEKSWLLEAIASTLIAAMDLNTAEAVIQSICNPQKRVEALSKLGTALVKADLANNAISVFAEAKNLAQSIDYDFQQGEALQALAKAMAQAKHYEEAERIALTIEVDWARTGALADLSAELAQDEKFAEAERIAEMIQDNGGRAFALRVLTMVYARTGNPTAAIQFFQEAGAISPVIEDPQIPVFALVILAITLKKAGYETQAQQIFQEALTTAKSIQEDTSQKSTLRAIVTDLAKQHLFSESEKFAQVIQDPLERAWALKEIAISLAQSNYKAKASELFKEVETLAEIVKDNLHEGLVLQHRDWVLSELSKALAQVGHFAEAERVAWTIEESWKQTDAFVALSKAWAQDYQFPEAERIARAISRTDWRQVEALCEIAVVSAHSGDGATAEKFLAEARQLTESIEDLTWKPWALRALVTAFIQSDQFVEAEAIIGKIEDKEKQAWALQELAIATGKLDHFIEAREAIKPIESESQKTWLFWELGKRLIQLGQRSNADELFRAAEDAAQAIEPKYRASALKELAINNAQLGYFTESQRIIGTIDHWIERDRALTVLARELTQAGHFSEAKSLIQTIEDTKQQRWALGSLAAAFIRQQRFADALKELVPQTLDDFVHILASCASNFEKLEPGLSVKILQKVVHISSWTRPDWQVINGLISKPVITR